MSGDLASKSTQDRDSETEHEIYLQTPMDIVLEGGSVRCISSSTPFYVGGIKFWSATPIHIYGSGKQRLSIRPSTDLGAKFMRGWFKLPDELKVRVLECSLVYSDVIEYEDSFSGPRHYHVTAYGKLLRSTPEIATMSREIYYAKNTFLIEISPYSRSDRTFLNRGQFLSYPISANNSLIRSLVFVTTVDDLLSTVFRRFTDGSYGFHNLRSLRFRIPGATYFSPRFLQRPVLQRLKEPFRFGCDGSISVTGDLLEKNQNGSTPAHAAILRLRVQ